jgi:hypothetical protein
VALGPSPSWTSAWGECEREIERREAAGEVRSLVYMLDMYTNTVDSVLPWRNIPLPGCWNGTLDR